MRVIFNNFSSLRLRTGIGEYSTQLLRELIPLAGDDTLTAFPAKWTERIFALGRQVPANRGDRPPRGAHHDHPRFANRIKAWLHDSGKNFVRESFRRICSRGGYDLYHEPNFSPWQWEVPAIATIHDLSVLLHPEWHPADRVALHEEMVRSAIPRLRHILTVSETIKSEIVHHLGVPPDRVTAVPNGARTDMRPMPDHEIEPARRRLKLPPTFLLHVGTIEPRKNVLTLLRSYCALDASVRDR